MQVSVGRTTFELDGRVTVFPDDRNTASVIESLVESEGVRVEVERNVVNRTVQVVTAMPRLNTHRVFEVTESAIESAETSEMVRHVIGRIRECARSMRADVVVEMCERGIEADSDEQIKRIADAVLKGSGRATCERLAIELMSHVERIGK